jgi:penicillin G amidase
MEPVSAWQKILAWTSGVIVVLLLAGAATAYWTVHRSFPQTDGTIEVPGLDSDVTVIRDGSGIPQVYADTASDLFYAQGYVQAQDRFFEMDFRRHVAAGRLAEMFGHDALETDMVVRAMGWRDVAEAELPLLAPATRGYLESFSAGVNAYLADHNGATLSLEYAALNLDGLDYTPELWTAADSLSWLKAIAWDLGSNIDDELERSLESVRLSRSQIAELFPPYPYAQHPPIVDQGAIVDGVFEQNAKRSGTRFPEAPRLPVGGNDDMAAIREAKASVDAMQRLLGTGSGLGSNAWAVSGDHTASGAPILANDPHLAPTIPGAWYQMGLHCTEISESCPFDVSGFTFAGLPGVVIGHNADIAWGFTNLYPDVQDLYLEKVSDHDTYLYDGKQVPLTTRSETFVIRGEEPVTINVRESRHGPLISDVSQDYATVGADAPAPPSAPERGNGYAVALRWTALKPGRTADALFAIDQAHDWDSFREAARSFVAPSQNLVYADREGHIGYQATGGIPIRRTGHGDWPVPGWDPAYEWSGYIPYDALPNVLDPDDGTVVTANQAVAKENYPFYIGDSYDAGYRAERIRQLLTAHDDLTVDDMAAIQLDDYCELARRLRPSLLAIDLPSGYYQAGQKALAAWDFHEDADSPGAAYFNVFWRQLLEHTFADQLPDDVLPDGNARWWQVVLELVKRPHDEFWDDVDTTHVRESRDDILRVALIDARDELTRLRSRDPHKWEWGSLHTLELDNQTLGADTSPVAFVFNRGGYALSGGPSVVNATSWDAAEGYEASFVPSMRMVIPLDDLDAARWIDLTGASGHAFDAHYTDQTALWLRGQTLPWPFTRDAVDAAEAHTLTLVPIAAP